MRFVAAVLTSSIISLGNSPFEETKEFQLIQNLAKTSCEFLRTHILTHFDPQQPGPTWASNRKNKWIVHFRKKMTTDMMNEYMDGRIDGKANGGMDG